MFDPPTSGPNRATTGTSGTKRYSFLLQLERGTRLGAYEIVEPLGSGGMGEVYRARDEKLDRSVAIKILATERTTRDGIIRFEREARAASALNHPHILHVYDIGSSRVNAVEVHYIAMELVEGETLRSRIERRPELRQIIEPLIDVAEALAKAHAAGIIHRDLKPDNIMLTRDGYAKVLDFGLAKLVNRKFDPDAPTETFAPTASGVVMGTVGYMSPEQVEGKEVDARTDIFSFGCILFEALTGARAFQGRSAIDTMHRIVHDVPAAAHLPPAVDRIVRKCLAKDPDERYQTIKEVAVDLREVRRTVESGLAIRVPRSTLSNRWFFVALLAIIAAVLVGYLRRPQTPIRTVPPAPFSSIDVERCTFTGDAAGTAISRSGKYLAYTRDTGSGRSLSLKQFSTGAEVTVIPLGPIAIAEIAFSPDEDYIYFKAGDDIERVPVVGGAAQKITSGAASMITFSPDGRRIAFVRRRVERGASTLVTTAIDGADEQVVYSGEDFFGSPAWSPNGAEIACIGFRQGAYPISLVVIDIRRHKLSVIRETRGDHVWMPDGRAFISPKTLPERAQQLRYVPFPRGKERRITADFANYFGASLTADGRTIASVQQVGSDSIWFLPHERRMTPSIMGRSDGAGMMWASDGTLLYFSVDREIHLRALRPNGRVDDVVTEPYTRVMISSPPSLSPDGETIAFSSHVDGSIWLVRRDGSNRRRLTSGAADMNPQWVDNSTIVFLSYRREGNLNAININHGVWRVSLAGGAPSVLDATADVVSVSPDRKRLLLRRPAIAPVIAVMNLEGGVSTELPSLSAVIGQRPFAWSPDGQAVDYEGDDGQLWRVPLAGRPARLLTNEKERIGDWAWSRDGRSLAITRHSESADVVLIHDRSMP